MSWTSPPLWLGAVVPSRRWPSEPATLAGALSVAAAGQWPRQYFSEEVFERLALAPFLFNHFFVAWNGMGFWDTHCPPLLSSVERGRPRASGGSDLRRMPSCSRVRLTFSYSSKKTASTVGESLTIFFVQRLAYFEQGFCFPCFGRHLLRWGRRELVSRGAWAVRFGAHRRTGRGLAVLLPLHSTPSWRSWQALYRLRLRRCGRQRCLLRLDRRGRVRLCLFSG